MSSATMGFLGTRWGRGALCIPASPASVMGTWISTPWGTATPCPAGACAACTTRQASTARGVGRASMGMRWLPTLPGNVHVRTALGADPAPLQPCLMAGDVALHVVRGSAPVPHSRCPIHQPRAGM